jgi:Sucrase/ferredoxin-like
MITLGAQVFRKACLRLSLQTRDARCGKFGPPLARRLHTLATQRGFADMVRVFECSHVGGHKVCPDEQTNIGGVVQAHSVW